MRIVPEERAVFMREQASSLYDISSYYFAKVLAEIPYGMVNPVIISVIIYWLVPLNTDKPTAVVIYSMINLDLFNIVVSMLVGYQAGSAYALFVGSLVTNRELLININPV
jgi:hypothetical protein